MKPVSKHLLITGVSTGIGLGAARQFAQRGYHVFGSVRRPEDAARLQQELGAAFTPLLFDVTDAAGVQRAAAQVTVQVGAAGLGGLINNAGIAITLLGCGRVSLTGGPTRAAAGRDACRVA